MALTVDQTPCVRKTSRDALLIVEKCSDDVTAQGSEVVTEPVERQAQPIGQNPERWLQRRVIECKTLTTNASFQQDACLYS